MVSDVSSIPNVYPAAHAPNAELSSLALDSVGEHFKGILLRHYIEKVIAENEAQNVTTDVSIIDLQSQKMIVGHNLDVEQFAASVNKVPVAALVLKDIRAGDLDFMQTLSWVSSDVRAGAGVYDQPGAPTSATIKDLLYDMLNPSGNTAVRILVNYALGGAANVNTRWQTELGLQHTYLQPLDANRFFLGNSTGRESLEVMRQLLHTNDVYGKFVRNALATNIYEDYGVRSQLFGNDYIVLANKVGILNDSDGNNRHDVGIVYNLRTHKSYGYSFMNTAPGDAAAEPTVQAGTSLMDMGRGVLRFAGDKPVKHQTEQQTLLSASVEAEAKILY